MMTLANNFAYHFGRSLPVVQTLSLVFGTISLRSGPTRCSISLSLLCSLQYHFGRGLPVVQSLSLVFVTVSLRPGPTRCSISVYCVRYSTTSAGAYPLFNLCLSLVFVTVSLRPGPTRCSNSVSLLCSLQYHFGRGLPVVQSLSLSLLCSLHYHFGRGLPVVQTLSLVFVTVPLQPGPTRCSISVSCVRYSTTSAGAYPLFNLCLLCSLQHYFGRDLPVVQSLSLVFVTVPLRPGPTRCSISVSCVHYSTTSAGPTRCSISVSCVRYSTTSAGAYPLFNLCLLCSLQYYFGLGLPVVQSLSLVFVTVPLRPGPTRCSISVSCVRYSTTSAGAYPLFNLCLLCSLQYHFGRSLPIVQSLSLVFVTALLRPGPTRCSISVSCVRYSTTSAGTYPLFNLCLLCSLQYHFGRGLPVVQCLSLVFISALLRPGPTRCSICLLCSLQHYFGRGLPVVQLFLLCSLQYHFGRGLPVVQSLSLVFVTVPLRPGPTRCSMSVSCVHFSTTSAGAYPLFNLCLLCSLQHYFGRGLPVVQLFLLCSLQYHFGRGLPVVQSLSLVFVTVPLRPGPTRCSISLSCVRYSTTSAGAYPLFNLCLSDIIDEDMSKNHRR